ncbi:MAG: translational GTPase TypA [Planctomycetes bacterium]|nr:translational GTPase TypA [Planctomycetota bacterium]
MTSNPASVRPLRNVAIIAHVDHGKTTLVDKMILQAGLLRSNQAMQECMLDSNALERERGITILAKNIAMRYSGFKINIFDTPGHADFGGEVERTLKMADGVLLLVDAFDGPMPQTRFVLRKALEAGLPPIVVINKMDRSGARPAAVLDAVFDLMVALGATDHQLDFPVIYAAGRDGWANTLPEPSTNGLTPLFETIIKFVPEPRGDSEGPTMVQVAALDWNEFAGRIAIGRVLRGRVEAGKPLVVQRPDGGLTRVQPRKVMVFEGMGRETVSTVECGDVCALEGLDSIQIGDTLCSPDLVEALPRISVDEPTIAMVFQINDGPLVGTEGKLVTSRQIRERLERETLKNVALRLKDTGRADAIEVSGRGVLHLGILIEEMRREGYEFCVGKPRVLTHEENGVKMEPFESVLVESPERHAGKVIELFGQRRAEMEKLEPGPGGTVRLEFRCPARGLIGLRTRLLNLSQGEAVLSHIFAGWAPWTGALPTRGQGVMISVDLGEAVMYALEKLKDRGYFFVAAGDRVYEGMVVGEHSKLNDIEVNCCREKKLTNIRTTSADRKLYLPPPRVLGVEDALEYIEDDELVEFTPQSIRLRKQLLREGDRRKVRRQEAS